jgi:hypothetical protein
VGECTSFDWVNKKNANTDSKFASLVTKRVQRKYLWKLDTRLKMKKLMIKNEKTNVKNGIRTHALSDQYLKLAP